MQDPVPWRQALPPHGGGGDRQEGAGGRGGLDRQAAPEDKGGTGGKWSLKLSGFVKKNAYKYADMSSFLSDLCRSLLSVYASRTASLHSTLKNVVGKHV